MKVLIKIGGTLLDDASARHSIAKQIASVPAAVTVVHGGGKQMTRFLEERGIASTFVRGLRVTTPDTIDAVLKVLAGSVNTQLVGALSSQGANPVGLTGLDGGIATATQLDPELGFVGKVVSSSSRLLETLTQANFMPVIACVAGGAGGQVYNVNGDSMAVAVASGWQVDRLIFLTDVPGVLDASKQLIPHLTAQGCHDLIASGVAAGGMQAKLNAAIDAVEGGVQEVRIVKGSESGIVTRVFGGEQAGTRVTA